MKNIFILAFIISASITAHAEESCSRGMGLDTAFGKLMSVKCSNKENGALTTRQSLELNGIKIVESRVLFEAEFNKSKSIWIYEGDWKGRPALYLLDISKTPAVVIVFGVNMSTNRFGYASWGKKNSVISIQRDAKFTYYPNGKMIPPSDEYANEAYFDTSLVEYRTDGSVYKAPDMRKFTAFVEYLSPPSNQ